MALEKMSFDEFAKALEQGEIRNLATLFNENLQSAYQPRDFVKLGFRPQIAKKLFVPLLISIPFNPLTGESSTDGYNMRNPLRTDIAPKVFLNYIKEACHKDEKLKKHYMNMASFTGTWDTSPTEEFTETDRTILFMYRRPITVSQASVKINSQAITGNKYPQITLLNSKQDDNSGEFIGKLSLMHLLAILSGSFARAEIQSFNEAIENGTTDCLSIEMGRKFLTTGAFADIKGTDSEQAMTFRQQIRGQYALTNVSPITLMPMIGIDVTPVKGSLTTFVTENGRNQEVLLPQFCKVPDFKSCMMVTEKYAVHNKVNDIIGHYFPKDPSRKKTRNVDDDLYANFCIMEYITDDTTANFASDADRNKAAQKMEAKTDKNPLYDRMRDQWVFEGLQEFMEGMDTFYDFLKEDNYIERLPQALLSMFKVVDPSMEKKALEIFKQDYPMDVYPMLYTDTVKNIHSEILLYLFPDEMVRDTVEILAADDGTADEVMRQLVEETTVEDPLLTQDENEPDANDIQLDSGSAASITI